MSARGSRRLARCFARLRDEGRSAFITFTLANDPDFETALALLKSLPAAGVDIVEFGMPFSEPVADGPTIQAAGLRALAAGARMTRTLDAVRAFRAACPDTPLILMGYYNPIYVYGDGRFTTDAAAAGADGVIVVDLPPEESGDFQRLADAAGLSLIRLVAPTTDDARLPKVLAGASGFVYAIAVAGVTGTTSADAGRLAETVARIRPHTALPIAIGFGIRSPAQAAEAAGIADAVVVGSALVEKLAPDAGNDTAPAARALGLARELAKAIRGRTERGAAAKNGGGAGTGSRIGERR